MKNQTIEIASRLLPSEQRENCISLMHDTFRAGADELNRMFDEMASWPTLPDKITYGDERWEEAEGEIGTAAEAGDMKLTKTLCDSYRDRVVKFCNFYRGKHGRVEVLLTPSLPTRAAGEGVRSL